MKLRLEAFTLQRCFFLLPAVEIHTILCENPLCGEVHGYALNVMWGEWGVGVSILF